MMSRLMSWGAALMLLVPCAMAQTPEADRQREYWRQQEEQRQEQQRRAQEEMQRQQKSTEDARKRQQQLDDETTKNIEDHRKRQAPAAPGGNSAGTGSDFRALGKEMLRLPPLPAERNVLLGQWRLEGAGQQNRALEFGLTGKGATPGMGELMGYMKSIESGQLACDMSFGRGMTFTPTTFSSGGAAGIASGPVAYRSRKKQVIVAIPGDSRANPMFFEIVGPDRIVSMIGGCALVRVGAPETRAATNAMTSPGNARTSAANASVPPAAGAAPTSSMALQAVGAASVVVDGAAFRCGDGSLLHVSLCQGNADDATCKLTELHLPGLQVGKLARRAEIAARVKSCDAGGIRYGADDKPVFVR